MKDNELIDLHLRSVDPSITQFVTLNDIIDKYQCSIILGAPGSGKTSLLKKYQKEHENIQYLSIKEFIKLNICIKDNITVLLLDGLDEYRSLPNIDKSFVVVELGNKIREITNDLNIKMVICCREMDWYGEEDIISLKNKINIAIDLFYICPLDPSQQHKLAKIFLGEKSLGFINKFFETGFLLNPQMFSMLADIYRQDESYLIKSKKELYFDFIKYAREHNPVYTQNKINDLEYTEMLKLAGYLAFYYMFAEIDYFSNDIINDICSNEKGYQASKLENILDSKIFNDRIFVHRTIAEFLCAYFIAEYKIKESSINFERVKNLFIINGKIPTELRGVFAWLCSFIQNEDLIIIDPFYQTLYGDNSVYSLEQKKRIILAVKEYTQRNPYFLTSKNWFIGKTKSDDFYNEQLDDFLIDEYESTFDMENHYIYFLNSITTASDILSSKIKGFLKNYINNHNIKYYYKSELLEIFFDNHEYLQTVLNKIIQKEIPDKNNRLQNDILQQLYPDSIKPSEILNYLDIYNNDSSGSPYYLYKTNYDDKNAVVLAILKKYPEKYTRDYYEIPYEIKSFINEYLLETALFYDEKYKSAEIYNILKEIWQYYPDMQYQSFRPDITEKLRINDIKMEELSNELFAIYLDDIFQQNDIYRQYFKFHSFFSLKNPNNKYYILSKKLNLNNEKNINIDIFALMCQNRSQDISNKEIIDLASTYFIKDEIYNLLYPQKQKWEIEDEKYKRNQDNKRKRNIEKNEEYFKNKTDAMIVSTFGDLDFISNLLFFDRSSPNNNYEYCLKDETFLRLKNIFPAILHVENFDYSQYLLLDSLAQRAPTANWNIDRIFYTACQLNTIEEYRKIQNKDLIKYLYICSLQVGIALNVIKGDYVSWIENAQFISAINILKEFIQKLLGLYLREYKYFITPFIEKEVDIEILKIIIHMSISETQTISNELIKNILTCYGFNLSLSFYDKILHDINISIENKKTLVAFLCFLGHNKNEFTLESAILLHKSLGDMIIQKRINRLDTNAKIQFADYFLSVFNSEYLLEFHNGVQSDQDNCASYVSRNLLYQLNETELNGLLLKYDNDSNIWKNRILHRINEIQQLNADKQRIILPISNIKKFLLSNGILNYSDFYLDTILKIKTIKQDIEDNRDNEKLIFWNNKKPKKEGLCRDLIVQKLKDRFSNMLEISREYYEGNNRSDINIKYKNEFSYEIQIECKKDSNKELPTGIKDQLIEKYLSTNVKYGIYLIFCFSKNINLVQMTTTLKNTIPIQYKENIDVISIDLRLKKEDNIKNNKTREKV